MQRWPRGPTVPIPQIGALVDDERDSLGVARAVPSGTSEQLYGSSYEPSSMDVGRPSIPWCSTARVEGFEADGKMSVAGVDIEAEEPGVAGDLQVGAFGAAHH